MPLFVRLPACLPRDSRVRACVHGRTPNLPGRACWLLGTHVAVDDTDPVLASPRRWVMRPSFTTVLVFFFHPALLRRSDHRPAGQGRGGGGGDDEMLHQSGGVQRPISSVFSLSFGQGHRGEGHGKEQGATSRPALDCSWCKAPSVRFDHPPPGLAGSLNPSRVASAPQKGATVCPSLQCQRIGHVHPDL